VAEQNRQPREAGGWCFVNGWLGGHALPCPDLDAPQPGAEPVDARCGFGHCLLLVLYLFGGRRDWRGFPGAAQVPGVRETTAPSYSPALAGGLIE